MLEATNRKAFAERAVEKAIRARRKAEAADAEHKKRVAAEEVAARAAATRDGSLLATLAELTKAKARGDPGAHEQMLDCLFKIQAA